MKTKTTRESKKQSSLHSFLQRTGIRHSKLSELIGMPHNTFKSKIAENNKYRFTDEELTKIANALCKIKEEINKYCNC